MIRPAISSDKARVLAMAKAFHAEAQSPFPFSGPMVSMLFDAGISDPDRLTLVYAPDGRPEGVLAAVAAPHHLAPVKIATELMWWVEPMHRGGAAAMLGHYEQWARGRGCVFSHMVGLGSDPATSLLYQRHGYQAAERHFIKPLTA